MTEPTTPTPGQAPAAPASAVDVPSSGFSTREEQMIAEDMDNWLANGKITKQEYDSYYLESGSQPPQPDTRTAMEKEIDAAMPPGKPDDFRLPSWAEYPGADVKMTPEVRAFDSMARSALAEARFTKEGGSALAKAVNAVAEKCGTMNDGQRELYRRSEDSKLRQLWKGDYSKNLSKAKQLAHEVCEKYPALREVLNTGPGDAAVVIAAIFHQAELLGARKGWTHE